MDHLLCLAGQVLPLYPEWEATYLLELEVHYDLLCSADTPVGEIPQTQALIGKFLSKTCEAKPRCQ